ncbi:hypothetical protein ACFY3U_27530 [Micromonospora sp. NPDC000089]|uniref:hypothetical protein n=1 Tax=unclassified Micromonospora TaxID=2617518 RepID=UPI00369BA89A
MFMRGIRGLLGALVAGACAATLAPVPASAQPTAPFTVVTVDVGDATGHPVKKSAVYDAGNASVYPKAWSDGVSMGVRAGDGTVVNLWATPPVGQRFAAGRTYQAAGTRDASHAGLDMSSDSTGCNGYDSYGSLLVRDVVHDPDGLVVSFAAAYEYHCYAAAGAVTGELRWNSNLGYQAVLASPSPVDFGRLAVGGPEPTRSVTFTVGGTEEVSFGSAQILGTGAPYLELHGGSCLGQRLQPGRSCQLEVSPLARHWGTWTANLELDDSSSFGKRVVPLTFTAYETAVGMYYPLVPQRLMDSRTGLGLAAAGPLPKGAVTLQVAGRGGVPASGAGSVVLNVTVTGPTADSFLTVYPYPEATPTASSINFAKGWLGSNNVTVKLGAGGKVSIYNKSGTTHVVVDVVGFYAASDSVRGSLGWGGQYHPVEATRLIDTRPNSSLVAGSSISGYVDIGPESPHVMGLILNITAVQPARPGFLTAWSGVEPLPTSSTVNYGAGKVVPNLAYVRAGRCVDCNGLPYAVPTYTIYTSQKTNLVVDVVGIIGDGSMLNGLRFTPLSPTRIVDSRSGVGTSGALGANVTRRITTPDPVLGTDTRALAMNVTAVTPTRNTVLTVWPADTGQPRPGVSNLNPAAGQIVSNAVLGGLGPRSAFNVHNLNGSAHVVADGVGRFYLYPGTSSSMLAAARPLTVRGGVVRG